MGGRADYLGAVKRVLTLAVVSLVLLLAALLSWIILTERKRSSVSNPVQIRLLSVTDAIRIPDLNVNTPGQLQFWATNTTPRRVHVHLRGIEVKQGPTSVYSEGL